MDLPTLANVTRWARDDFGHGCSNEIVRGLSGLADEPTVNSIRRTSAVADSALLLTKQHLAQCVVGLLERPDDTLRVLQVRCAVGGRRASPPECSAVGPA